MARRRARNRKVRRVHVTNLLVKLHDPRQRIGARRRNGRAFPLDGRHAGRRVACRGDARRRAAVARPVERSVRCCAYARRAVGDAGDGKRPDAARTRECARRKVRKRDVFYRKALDRLAERERGHSSAVQRIGNARNRQRRRRVVQKVRGFVRSRGRCVRKRIAINRFNVMAQSEGERHRSVQVREVAARRPYLVGRIARYPRNDGQRSRRARKRKVRRVHVANPFAERNLPGKRVRVRRRRNRIVPRNRRNVRRRTARPPLGYGRRIPVAACVRRYARLHAYPESACAAARNRRRIYVGGPGEPRRLGGGKPNIVRRKALHRLAKGKRSHERPCRNLRNAAYLHAGGRPVRIVTQSIRALVRVDRLRVHQARPLAVRNILIRSEGQRNAPVQTRQIAPRNPNTVLFLARRGKHLMACRRARNRKVRRVHVANLLVKRHDPRQRIGARRRRRRAFPLDGRYAGRRVACRRDARRRAPVARPVERSVRSRAYARRAIGDAGDRKRPDAARTRKFARRKVRKRDVFYRKALDRLAKRERGHSSAVQRIGDARNR